ncbi:MAG: hypothetical protein ACOVO1_06960 [Chitinophagaceae bacterium]
MNTALSDTILYVTGKQGIENSSQYELETMIAEYPYFAPAQLVYATKLKSENSFKLQTQVQKTGLFFNNFKWLQYQLMEVGANGFKSFSSRDYSTVEETLIEQPILVEANAVENFTPAETVTEKESNIDNVALEKPFDFISNISIPTVEEVKDLMSGIDDKIESVEATEGNVEPISTIEVENKTDVIEEIIATEQVDAENISTFTPISSEEILEKEPLETTNDIHAEIAALKANWHHQHQEEMANEVSEINKEETIISEPEKQPFPSISTDIASLKNEWNKPVEEVASQSLPFETEPYYTIDYFASQGIKFDYSQAPHDKLTSKMLRFTDWLKKMKTVKPEQETILDDPELDSAIQNIASMSNQTKEVVTETMAEIFAKQGKKEKAIQLYIKLSFLIPDKSAYFATQIKELKGI